MDGEAVPAWAHWTPSPPYSIGIEEEVMLLDPCDWALARRTDQVLSRLSPGLTSRVTAETHEAAIELASTPHATAHDLAEEASGLRQALHGEIADEGLRAGAAGTHPFAMWTDTRVSSGARYQLVYESMRELARREPTFALHVHVGVSDPDAAIVLLNRLRAQLPLLLALSANSPFWQGRDTGLASARTPIFQAFPRVGIPRRFDSYLAYVGVIDELLRCEAFPEPTFLWWDVRLQPRFGTVEVRVMDAQSSLWRSVALAALVQTLAHLELEEGYHGEHVLDAAEILDENRFLAARDGIDARLIDPVQQRRVPAREQLAQLLASAAGHAQDLGCEWALDAVTEIARDPGAGRQRRRARRASLPALVACLADEFVAA